MSGGGKEFNRRSIHLQNYNYSEPGYYFVTICIQDNKCLFGEVINDEMILNNIGKMIREWWLELENKFFHTKLDKFIIMPNHFHGIINITIKNINVEADLCVCPNKNNKGEHAGLLEKGEHAGSPLHEIIKWFKTMTTNEYIKNVKKLGWSLFERRLWQRNYYEHVIRNEKSLDNIRQYIMDNPLNWDGNVEDFKIFSNK